MSLDEYAKGAQWGYSLAWFEAKRIADRRGAEGVIEASRPDCSIAVALRGGGPYSLYCFDCGEWVPNTANNEMSREGVFAHSHCCKEGS